MAQKKTVKKAVKKEVKKNTDKADAAKQDSAAKAPNKKETAKLVALAKKARAESAGAYNAAIAALFARGELGDNRKVKRLNARIDKVNEIVDSIFNEIKEAGY